MKRYAMAFVLLFAVLSALAAQSPELFLQTENLVSVTVFQFIFKPRFNR
jgi:hypothetical protein